MSSLKLATDTKETPPLLPDSILRTQVCQNCFQYLSVPPICINRQGETICGRCSTSNDTVSTFNTIAERFSFKCTNHLNGCSQILRLSETIAHERVCPCETKECQLCSFSGNLTQILNHSLKLHPKNVSTDGKFSCLLSEKTFQKSVLLLIDNNVFNLIFKSTYELVTITICSVTNVPVTTINQYGIRFFKSDDPTNVDYVHADYGLFNNMTYFKKNKDELITFFGLEVTLTCEILLQQFSLDEREFNYQQRYGKLRQLEGQVNHSRNKLQAEALKMSQQDETYNSAMSVIKRISYDFFKCRSCQKIVFSDVYFCPRNHCCCKHCLKNFCKICNSVQEFNRLKEIDNLSVPCDWPDCNQIILYKDYLEHKSACSQRPYKCPLLNCHEVLFSSQKLIEHWHCVLPTLTNNKIITAGVNTSTEYYWLIENDLYHVDINFTTTHIHVLISEITVFTNNVSFKCEAFNSTATVWQSLNYSTFCGKFQVNMQNRDQVPFGISGAFLGQADRIHNSIQKQYQALRIVYKGLKNE